MIERAETKKRRPADKGSETAPETDSESVGRTSTTSGTLKGKEQEEEEEEATSFRALASIDRTKVGRS